MKHHILSHKFRKRPTYKYHIQAKQRRAQLQQKIDMTMSETTTMPNCPIAGGQPLTQQKHSFAEDLHDWILGGQDGLVNVLGTILGVAIVTTNKYIILVAGIASLFAESISMAAVAYTSVKASHLYYASERETQRKAIEENPILQREILIDVYERKGLNRKNATEVVHDLTKDKNVWLEMLMEEHLRMYKPDETGPLRSAFIVGMASFIGSIVPLFPFFFLVGKSAILLSCTTSLIVLFGAGAVSAKITIGDWKARGFEMAAIGMTAAAVSFLIGYIFVKGIMPVT